MFTVTCTKTTTGILTYNLTVGKEYQVFESYFYHDMQFYRILDDNGSEKYLTASLFKISNT